MVDPIGFPRNLLHPDQSALCLFAAAFGGVNDVMFLKRAGLQDVLLIDNDRPRLFDLAQSAGYRAIWSDAFEAIDNIFLQKGSKFNIVVSDQWTNLDARIHEEYFVKLLALATEYLILGICQEYINTLPERPPGIYYKRSNNRGGVYWRVIKINP